MIRRDVLAALAFATVLVLAGCAGVSGDTAEPQGDPGTNVTVQVQQSDDDGSTVAVGGRGSVTADPDAATLTLSVAAQGDDPETVRNRLSENASAVRQALLEYGLAEDQIRSDEFRIRENYRARREPESDHPTYIGHHRIVVDVETVDAVGDIIDVAVESGPVRVNDVRFRLSDERREQLRDEALAEAVADARSEAELVASAENLRIESAERIATDRVSVERPDATVVREMAATPTATAGDGADTRVEAGEVTVSASVTVVYNASKTDG